jgi:hypothetical protein
MLRCTKSALGLSPLGYLHREMQNSDTFDLFGLQCGQIWGRCPACLVSAASAATHSVRVGLFFSNTG